MFFATIVGPEVQIARARAALDLHGDRLRKTGWSGPFVEESFPGGLLAWDRAASHSDLFRDPARGTVLLRAGYLASNDEWGSDGRHTTEGDNVWGEFAAVVVRALPNDRFRIDALSDPAASWPIYHARREDTLVVSNDPHFIALALGFTRLSSQGVYAVLAYHHSLGVETTIEGVERLFPGDRLSAVASPVGIEDVRIESRRAYIYASRGAPDAVLECEALNDLRLGVAAIRPLCDGGFADATVQLSGGLDSRLTAAVLAEVFPERPDVVTLDLSHEAEMGIAREVAARLGYPHRTALLADTSLDTMNVGWLLTGGQVSPYAAAGNILSYESAHRSADGRVLLVGAWTGDCLIGSYIPLIPGMASGALRGVLVRDWASKRGPGRADLGGSVTGPARKIARVAQRRLRRGLLFGSGSTPAQVISYWAMFVRQPTFSYIAPAMLTSHVLPITPVLARPYLEQLLRLDGRQIIGKNFYRAMIANGFPSLAGIPNANTGRPVTSDPVAVSWVPLSLSDLYRRLPASVQHGAQVVLGLFRRRAAAVASSAEVDHWSAILSEDGESDTVAAGDIVVHAGPSSHIHVRAVARGLRWTADYLKEGEAKPGAW